MKRRGSSKAGRPRKPGPRHPSGKRVQRIEPNAVVVDGRRALLGDAKADLSAAEDPMMLAFARGWLTEAEVRAGKAFAACYRATHPSRRTAPSYEAPDAGDRDLRRIREMSDAEITAAFDAMMEATGIAATSEGRQQAACARYARWSAALSQIEHGEVFAAFVRETWPQWLTWMIAGRDQTADSARRKSALHTGLAVLIRLQRGTVNLGCDSLSHGHAAGTASLPKL